MVGRRNLLLAALAAGALCAQQDQKPQNPKTSDKPAAQVQEQQPPEEDETLKPKEYAFNPLEAERDVKVGLFYYKKSNYKAAANRFREATLWNPSLAEAFLRLGESEEKLNNKKAAQEAYAKYLELAPDAKDAEAIKKKLASKK
jgi:tetratricopeptide (TPR) repeat protein